MNIGIRSLRDRTGLTGLLLAGMAAAIVASPAARSADTPAASGQDNNDCVFSRSVNDWRVLDSRNLVIWGPGRHHAYHVTLGFSLPDLRSEESVAFVDRNGDGRLCGYGMDSIVTASGPFRESATIIGMTRVDEAQVAALAEQYKVKIGRAKPEQPAE